VDGGDVTEIVRIFLLLEYLDTKDSNECIRRFTNKERNSNDHQSE